VIEKPIVTTNDQGPDAEKQAGIVAHNDIPAATNDRTDAPRLDVDPAAANATAPLAPEGQLQPDSGPADGSAQNETVISAAAAGETPNAVATKESEHAAAAALAAEEARDAALYEYPVPNIGGVWQCQNPKCMAAFEDGTQTAVQAGAVPLHCPHCNSDHVLYIGEKPQEATISG
jgi:hypothetical protein